MTDIVALCIEIQDRNYGIFIAGDFDLTLHTGSRGDWMLDLCSQFSLQVANRFGSNDDPSQWIFRSSTGLYRRLDFILHSASIECSESEAIDGLHLGSDHRAMYSKFQVHLSFII